MERYLICVPREKFEYTPSALLHEAEEGQTRQDTKAERVYKDFNKGVNEEVNEDVNEEINTGHCLRDRHCSDSFQATRVDRR